jgi:acyl-CoA synthetase (AMP-forming)/AMP-acid ligase II
MTYGEMLAEVEHVAAVLAARGVGHGDRVGWWADVHLHAGTLYYALAHLGAVFVPLNPRFNDDECRAVLDIAQPVLVVADEGHPGDVTIDQLRAERAPSVVDWPEVHETDADVIFFTSGTTGQPKGCVLSHRSNRMRTGASSMTTSGPIMTMFPQFHWGGWSFAHNAWYFGHELALVDGGDTEALLDTMARRQVASFYGIPAVWRRILEADRSGYDLTSLQEANTGTSATPPELLRAIHEAFPGTTTRIGYGATEAGGLCQLPPEDVFRKHGSVGFRVPGHHVRLEDDELWAKSPQAFLGYYDNPEATAAAVVDGWYRTGDLVERDDEGYMWVVGRVKDMIRTGGETVAPAEVDVVLQRHPAVADGAVAGVPDVDWGEVVTAFVVLRPGHQLEVEEVRRHCAESLAAYKHPRRLFVVEAIPRTGPTGQVQRRRLVEIAQRQSATAD